MTGKQLKNSILQWAIQGKLVPQDPNDEPASVLLEKIRAEKARLIKEGKIKKDKKESIIYRGEDNSYYEKFADGKVVCIDDEIPFEIPETWTWCRVSQIVQLNPKNEADDNTNAAFIPMDKIEATYLSNFTFATRKWSEIKSGFTHFANGDVAFAKITPCFQNRKSMILKDLPNGIGAGTTELKVLRVYGNTIAKEYLLFFLESPYFVEEAAFKGTANQQRIISGYLENKLFPLPPLSEQKRIVTLVEESFMVAEKYGSAQIKLDSLNANINNSLKKSFLQEAIQGKLVPQDASEESASILLQRIKEEKLRLVKEGKLKKKDVIDSTIYRGDDNKYFEKKGKETVCINEEIPFEIPDTWAWVRLDDICEYIQRGKSPKYSPIKKYPVIAQKCNQWSGFSIDKAQFIVPETISSYGEERKLQDRDLLWNSTGLGTLGRMAIYYSNLNPYELAVADSHVTVIRPLKKYISPEYLYAYFSSHSVQSVIEDKSDGSTKQKELATNTVKAYLVPLPPCEEQKRIVNRIDEVFAHLTL